MWDPKVGLPDKGLPGEAWPQPRLTCADGAMHFLPSCCAAGGALRGGCASAVQGRPAAGGEAVSGALRTVTSHCISSCCNPISIVFMPTAHVPSHLAGHPCLLRCITPGSCRRLSAAGQCGLALLPGAASGRVHAGGIPWHALCSQRTHPSIIGS